MTLYDYCQAFDRIELLTQWSFSENDNLNPEEVTSGSRKKVWWQCEKGHSWQAAVSSRVKGSGCPVCAGKTVVAGENDLRSAHPRIAAQWASGKNGPLSPEQISPSSNRTVWWQCQRGHFWKASVAARTSRDQGCPYCTNRKVLAGFNDLATRHPAIAAQWHPSLNEGLTPDMVSCGSRKKVWWQCGLGHSWKAVIYSRTGEKRAGCPVCAGRTKAQSL